SSMRDPSHSATLTRWPSSSFRCTRSCGVIPHSDCIADVTSSLLRQQREGVLIETGRTDYEGWPKWATSLNERRMGPLSVTAMRVIDATATNVRQLTPSPTPRAQATAALIGETWLTTTRSASTAAGARSSHAV